MDFTEFDAKPFLSSGAFGSQRPYEALPFMEIDRPSQAAAYILISSRFYPCDPNAILTWLSRNQSSTSTSVIEAHLIVHYTG